MRFYNHVRLTMQRMRSVSTKNTALSVRSSIVCNSWRVRAGRLTEQSKMTRTDELLGYAQGFRPQPAAVRSAALHCTNPLLGFASNPSYLIGLRPMAEREGFESSLAANRIHCQSGKPLKHSHHYFRIRASVAQYGTRFGNT